MKKLLLFALLFSACWSTSEKDNSTVEVEIETTFCDKPFGLTAFYNETERTIDVLWDASASTVIHYMIRLDENAYQVVDFVKNFDSNYPGRKFSFTDVSHGAHTICVRSVCLEDQDEGKTPLPSQEVCTQLELTTAMKKEQNIPDTDIASVD